MYRSKRVYGVGRNDGLMTMGVDLSKGMLFFMVILNATRGTLLFNNESCSYYEHISLLV